MNHPKIIICFIGGSGGNFIASICEYLLYKNSTPVANDGSYHNLTIRKHLGNILPLNNTPESFAAEYESLLNLPQVPLAIGHFRNLAFLQELGYKVIYINFQDEHRKEINRRVLKKVSLPLIENITEDQYNMLKGGSWPTWEEYKNGTIPDELDTTYVKLKDKDECLDWIYVIPPIAPNICCIEFRDILNGYKIIDQLVNFLEIDDFDRDSLIKLIDDYREKQ